MSVLGWYLLVHHYLHLLMRWMPARRLKRRHSRLASLMLLLDGLLQSILALVLTGFRIYIHSEAAESLA